MTLQALYNYADRRHIPVISYPMPRISSMSVMDEKGQCYIGIDPHIHSCEEKVKLAHEIGHCATGAFYNRYSPFGIREKCEHRATVWAIKKLIRRDELNEAVDRGITTPWDLAEHFDVPEWFIVKAIKYYKGEM